MGGWPQCLCVCRCVVVSVCVCVGECELCVPVSLSRCLLVCLCNCMCVCVFVGVYVCPLLVPAAQLVGGLHAEDVHPLAHQQLLGVQHRLGLQEA